MTDTSAEKLDPIEVIITNWMRAQRVMTMPYPRGVMKSYLLTAGDPIQLAGKDLRRGRLQISFLSLTGSANGFALFGTQNEVQMATKQVIGTPVPCGIWGTRPPGSAPMPPLVMTHADEVFAGLFSDDTASVYATVITERLDD